MQAMTHQSVMFRLMNFLLAPPSMPHSQLDKDGPVLAAMLDAVISIRKTAPIDFESN